MNYETMEELDVIHDGLGAIDNTRPVIFKYKPGYGDNQPGMTPLEYPGFMAEELAVAIPRSVQFNPDGSVVGFDYNMIIPYLCQAIKDLKDQLQQIQKNLEGE